MSQLYRKFSGDESDICCSTFGRINRQLLVNCDYNNKVHLWNIPENKYVNILAQCKSSVQSVCFDSKEVDLSFGSACGSIVLYNIESSKVYCSIPNGHKKAVDGIDFHPYGTYFASSSSDCVLKVWDVKHKRCITQLDDHVSQINTLKWSPDGSWIVLFSNDGSFSKMFDVIGGRVIHEFDSAYTGDFHPNELVMCTVSCRKTITRRSTNTCTVEIWDLQTFTLISELNVNHHINLVYFSQLKSLNDTLTNIYLFTVSDKEVNIYLWDPELVLIATRDIHQPFIKELSVVDNIMLTCSSIGNSSLLWIHDFSNLSSLPHAKRNLIKDERVLESLAISSSHSSTSPTTPTNNFKPIVSTPKHSNIFAANSKFKTSTVVRKNLKPPTVIDNSQERRQSVDGSIKMAMEKHLLRNTFILSPGSIIPTPKSGVDDPANFKLNFDGNTVLDKFIENVSNYDDTLGVENGTLFEPKRNSTMSSESLKELSSKTMILQKSSSNNITLTTDHLLSSGLQKSGCNNLVNVSFYRNFDYRHANVINHLNLKNQNFNSILSIITTNTNRNSNLLQKMLESIVVLNDLDSLKILISKTTSIQEQWTMDVCKTFLDILSNKILKNFNIIEAMCVVKKIISKIIIDHGDTLKDKASTILYKKCDLKLECKQLMKKISCILAPLDDKNLQTREHMDAKEVRYLIKSAIGSGL